MRAFSATIRLLLRDLNMLSSTGNELRGKHNYYKYHNKPVAGKLWWASSLAEMRKRKMVLYVLPHLPGKDYSTALARIQLSQLRAHVIGGWAV